MKIVANKYENHGSVDEMLSAFKSMLRSDIETTTEVYADSTEDTYIDELIDYLDAADDFNYTATYRKAPKDLNIYITDYDDEIIQFSVPHEDLSFNNIYEDARYIIDEVNSLMEE